VKCKDPISINAWFRLVYNTRVAYRIPNKDVYNFNKTRFIIGIATTLKVITNSNYISRVTIVQLGNYD
jgi:hypothetical protein